MKKFLFTLLLIAVLSPSCHAGNKFLNFEFLNSDKRGIISTLNSQVKYANKMNFDKFISTYDKNYKNGDGYDLEVYSKLVQDLWKNYDNIKYDIKIKDIILNNENAEVKLTETSHADISASRKINGALDSEANSIYYLKKINGKWKVTSDKILDEATSMLFGEAMNLNINLTAPKEVTPGFEYTASLEFVPPKDTFAIASIAKDKVEYPQPQAKEVFRKLPEDNILERLFISNSDNANEYVIASIGLTKADIKDLNIRLSLTGYGYKIIRVNVVDKKISDNSIEENNVKN